MIPRQPSQRPSPISPLTVAAIGLGSFLVTFDFSLNVALPAVTAALGTSLEGVRWIIIVYLGTTAALLLTWGRAGDLLGHRAIYLVGLAAFSLGSVACAAAPSLGTLIAARAGLGLGQGMILASTPAIMTLAFPPDQRGRAMGWLAWWAALGSLSGALAGGWLVDAWGWRAIFWVRPPVGALAIAATLAYVPRDAPRQRAAFDGLGAALLALALPTLLLAISRGSAVGWGALSTLGLLALGAALLAAFVRRQWTAPTPLLRLGLFRSAPFTAAVVSWALGWLAAFGIWVLVPFYLQGVLGLSASATGVLFALLAGCMSLATLASGHLADRWGSYGLALAGIGVTAASLLLIATLGERSGFAGAAWRLALFGAAFGWFQSPNNAGIVGGARAEELGVASGVISLSRYFGVVTSVALATSIYAAQRAHYLAGGHLGARLASVLAQRDSFLVATAIGLLALGVAFFGRPVRGLTPCHQRRPHRPLTTRDPSPTTHGVVEVGIPRAAGEGER